LSESRLVVILGVGGSGKTEIALNLAAAWASALDGVHIVDFDLVTPYFRTQDVREALACTGVEVIAPPLSRGHIDVPFIPPEVPHIITRETARAVFDVGGDEVGATTIRQFAGALRAAGARAYVVVNTRRPGMAGANAIADSTRRLAAAAGLDIAGLIANTHLRDETTWGICLQGLRVTEDASEALGVPVVLLACAEKLAAEAVVPESTALMPLRLNIVLPWVA